MVTIQNSRRHDLSACGVLLKPGRTDVSDEDFEKLSKDPQFKLWYAQLNWVGLVKYSETDLRKIQDEAKAKQDAADAAKKAAEEETAMADAARKQQERAAELKAEADAASARTAAAKAKQDAADSSKQAGKGSK